MHGLVQGLGIVIYRRSARYLAAPIPGHAGQDLGVAFYYLPGLGLGLMGEIQDLITGGNDVDSYPVPDRYLPYASAQQGAHVIGGQFVVLGQQKFRGHDILSDAAHILPGVGGLIHGYGMFILLVDFFHHDHAVHPFWKGGPGIDFQVVPASLQQDRLILAGDEGSLRLHSHAVHGGTVKCGRGTLGPQRLGSNPARSFLGGNQLGAQKFPGIYKVLHPFQGLVYGYGLQIDVSWRFHNK